MPIVKQGEKDTSEVGLVDFDFISKNPVIKGI